MYEQTSTPSDLTLPPWHARSNRDIVAELGTDPARGLSSSDAAQRLAKDGPNALHEEKQEPWWHEALEALAEPLQLLLIAVAGLYFWLGETEDAFTILAVILAVAVIEVVSELRAKRAVAALSSMAAPIASVLRDGRHAEVATRELVAGDIVLLAAGHRVPADLRLLESVALRVDESSLTGESAPVSKSAEADLAAQAELGDRSTMAHAGTLVVAGKGRGVVVATGATTQLGHIAGLVREAREPRTPLQEALRQLARWLMWAAIGFSVLVPVLGILVAGRPVKEMLLIGLTLAFATIPEELPILITIVLGLGAYRMAQRQAIVKRLRAAETLGSVSVVATDKTGTLTENRMRVAALVADAREQSPRDAGGKLTVHRMLLIGALANDAQSGVGKDGPEFIGDPTETALLSAAQEAGIDVAAARAGVKVLDEFPFGDERKRMSVLVEYDGGRFIALKGSPESTLWVCSAIRHDGQDKPLDENAKEMLQQSADAMASRGLRVLGLAEKRLANGEPNPDSASAAESGMVFLGLVGLEDPPRAEVPAAVRALQDAGVRVMMVTGDHPSTAIAIAERVGIDTRQPPVRGSHMEWADDAKLAEMVRQSSVFARITPEHKLKVVRALQAQGEVVAVTGDGVNDAPALREAAIGVTMGRSGTDVAREAADLVLADDNFATVTEAVRTGRVLYANLRKAVRYYLAAKVALVSASLAAVLLKLPVPFEPVQIILMELFMDLGASVTFVAEPPERDVMAQPPRDPRRPFMDRSMQLGILFGGLSLGAAVLVAYLGAARMGADLAQAQTAAFAAWMIGHVVLAAHMRAERQPLLATNPLANKPFLLWAACAVGLLLVAALVPGLQHQLHLSELAADVWWLVIAVALIVPSWWEPWKWFAKARTSATP
jgi:P-type Ca2+ transporter type 2C